MSLSPNAENVNWLLTQFLERTAGTEQALVVSSDGILIALASSLERSAAERVAAVVTGMRSLAEGAARLIDTGRMAQVIVEFDTRFLFVAAVSGGSTVGVVARRGSDLGLIGYEVAMLVQRVGTQLTPELISELKHALVNS